MNRPRQGVASAVAAFVLWGVLPLFWKSLDFLPPATIIAHRTVWSLVLLGLVLGWQRRLGEVFRGLASWQGLGWHALSGSLLATNWLLYVWATLNGRILEGALGYYLNPFFNMLFGAWIFGERQNRRQLLAVIVALTGVAFQFPAVKGVPWVSLVLALTFALYAVVRKKAPLGALTGLAAETTLMVPLALGWLAWQASHGQPWGGSGSGEWLFVIGTGLATATPLLCFGHAARTIPLTLLGILQFIGPSLQFLIGWLHYGELMNPTRMVSFALIWTAVAIYAADALGRKPDTKKAA